jgi:hypothetical protein
MTAAAPMRATATGTRMARRHRQARTPGGHARWRWIRHGPRRRHAGEDTWLLPDPGARTEAAGSRARPMRSSASLRVIPRDVTPNRRGNHPPAITIVPPIAEATPTESTTGRAKYQPRYSVGSSLQGVQCSLVDSPCRPRRNCIHPPSLRRADQMIAAYKAETAARPMRGTANSPHRPRSHRRLGSRTRSSRSPLRGRRSQAGVLALSHAEPIGLRPLRLLELRHREPYLRR